MCAFVCLDVSCVVNRVHVYRIFSLSVFMGLCVVYLCNFIYHCLSHCMIMCVGTETLHVCA